MSNWIIREASRINVSSGHAIFATGYGPSGLPHIGTFAEVYRTVMVIKAFKVMNPSIKCSLYVFSDDSDGLRKIPDNIPNKEMLKNYIGVSLRSVPDPFEIEESYGMYMNKKLCSFLDAFGFEYEFKSSVDCYKSGIYNEMILKILENYDDIVDIVLPIIGEERSKTYSPFLPICSKTKKVLQVAINKIDKQKGTIFYFDENENEIETSVIDGNCKLQWRADWGMRWAAFDINYEMHGKDLQSSAAIGEKICRKIGCTPPNLFRYELFLDEEGKKISKSKGNGIGMEEWMKYAPIEGLKMYLSNDPSRARKLYFGVIPKSVDDYISLSSSYDINDSIENKMNNFMWYINNDNNLYKHDITFSMLLNLASASGSGNKEMLWGLLKNYNNDLKAGDNDFLDKMIDCAIKYYADFIEPNKVYLKIDEDKKNILNDFINELDKNINNDVDAKFIQNFLLSFAKQNGYENTGDWFMFLYKSLFGQSNGPRMGSFIKIYGINNFIDLVKKRIEAN